MQNIEKLETQQKSLLDKLSEQQQVAQQLRTESMERMSSNLGGAGLNSSYINALSGLQKSSFGTGPLMQAYQQTSSDINQAYRQKEELEAQEKARQEQMSWDKEKFGRQEGLEREKFDEDKRRWESEFGLKLSEAEAALIGSPDEDKARILKAKKDKLDTGSTTIEEDVEYGRKYGVDLRKEVDDELLTQLTDMDAIIDNLLKNKNALRMTYGFFRTPEDKKQNKFIELFVSNTQSNIDMLINMLAMEGREKLKGAGHITDYEMQMLKDSLSTLTNKATTPAKAISELERLKKNMNVVRGNIDDYRSLLPNIYDTSKQIENGNAFIQNNSDSFLSKYF
jgi:hypothetical protein